MNSRLGSMALVVPLLAFIGVSASADTVVPTKIGFASEVHENDSAKVCEFVVDLENPMPPERVKFAAFADYDKSDRAVAIGFRIGAARRSPSGVFEPVGITGATIESATFNSADEMDLDVYGEETFTAATSDGIVASRLLRSVVGGQFNIDVLRDEEGETAWTFKISAEPPADVRLGFEDCLEGMMPGHVLSRPHPVGLRR